MCYDKQEKKKASFIAAAHIFHCFHNSVFFRLDIILRRSFKFGCDNIADSATLSCIYLVCIGQKEYHSCCSCCLFYDLSSDIWDDQFHYVNPGLLRC